MKWKDVIGKEFNLGTIHWGIYWPDIEAAQGQFDFSISDTQVAFAQEKDLEIRGHALVYPGLSVNWLDYGNFSDEQLLAILRNHIIQIMTRYKGQIHQWVVVNEPYLFPYRQNDIFYQHFGYDYIEFAFQVAREADSSAILIYNDVNNHCSNSETTTLTQKIVKRLKSKDLIDGVGLQMHLDGNNLPNKQEVISSMRSYGVPVHVTEFDVDSRDLPGTQEERFTRQAETYRDMLEACFESGVCESFTVWGIGDKFSWLERSFDSSIISPDADPTPFNDDFQPKPAYFALLEILSEYAQR